MELKKGNMIKLTLDDSFMDNCDDTVLWLDYKNIPNVVEIGSKIYIDDGLMSLQVKEIGGYQYLGCVVEIVNKLQVPSQTQLFSTTASCCPPPPSSTPVC